MRAIVLVGGEGTRLRPLTLRTPKPLAPMLNRPLLEHLLRHLGLHGIRSITLALTTGRSSDAVRDAFGDGAALGLALDYAYEQTPLGSGGAIANAAADWGEPREPFLVCNGDLVTDLDVTALVASHRARGAELTISLYKVPDPSRFGVVRLDATGRITRFVEKPPAGTEPSNLINAGTWLFEPGLLRELPPGRYQRVEEGLFPVLAGSGRGIYGFTHYGVWTDVGTPEAYRAVNLELLGGSIPACLPAGWPRSGVMTAGAHVEAGTHVSAPALIGAGSVVRAGATLGGPVVLGERCTIEAQASVTTSVLWDGVTVGRGAVVRDCVLASGVVIGADATVEDVVLGHDARVPAGARVAPGALAASTGSA
ncbi:MAG: NDP-sugar synthase [Dehalococcoidia bacterium]|nr:NDP-sugar synthase [Dehalococcoidia bacterium]